MMARKSTLKEELRKEFEEEAQQIHSQGERQAEAILNDSQSEQEAMRRKAEAEIDRDIANRRTRALSKARIEQRNAVLRAEKEVIDALFIKLQHRFVDMASAEPDRYAELLWAFYSSGRKLLPGDRCRLYPGENTESFLQRIGERKDTEIIHKEGFYGLILESADGKIRCDYTIQSLLSTLRATREAEIREIIFGGRA